MKNIFNIVRKELKRVFQDKRLLFSTIILPGLLLFMIYSLMGNLTTNLTDSSQTEKYIVYIENPSTEFLNIYNISENNLDLKINSDKSKETIKKASSKKSSSKTSAKTAVKKETTKNTAKAKK